MKNNIIVKEHVVTSDKIDNDVKISLFADLHYSNILKKEILQMVEENVYKQNPDFICVPGDIIDMTNILDNRDMFNESLNFFEKIGKIAPTFISLGSHDFSRMTNGKWELNYNIEWFRNLNKLSNVNLLHNRKMEDGQVRFIGYTPTYNYYYNGTKAEDTNMFIEDFNKKMPQIDNNKLNILLCHTPRRILDKKCIDNIETLKNMRLILAGHMHNGMLPDLVDKIIKNDIGLIAPNKTPFPRYARGVVNKNIDGNDVSMIITGGVTKIQESAPEILHSANDFYKGHMDTIYVKSLKK